MVQTINPCIQDSPISVLYLRLKDNMANISNVLNDPEIDVDSGTLLSDALLHLWDNTFLVADSKPPFCQPIGAYYAKDKHLFDNIHFQDRQENIDVYLHLTALIQWLIESDEVSFATFESACSSFHQFVPSPSLPGKGIDIESEFSDADLLIEPTYEDSYNYYLYTFKRYCAGNGDIEHLYRCKNLFEVCYAILDHVVRHDFRLFRCGNCGKYAVQQRKRGAQSQYCSRACVNAVRAKNSAKYRESGIEHKVDAVRKLFSRREEKNPDDRAWRLFWSTQRTTFTDTLHKMKAKWQSGEISDEELLDFLDAYHQKIKSLEYTPESS